MPLVQLFLNGFLRPQAPRAPGQVPRPFKTKRVRVVIDLAEHSCREGCGVDEFGDADGEDQFVVVAAADFQAVLVPDSLPLYPIS